MENRIVYTTIELFKMLNQAIKEGKDQSVINQLAFEIVCRIYVPFSNMSFDDMLLEYGYVDTREKQNGRNKR